MASVSIRKKRASEKVNKCCLTLHEKIKALEKNKNRKMCCRGIGEEFNIFKMQGTNVIASEARLRADYGNFQGKSYKHVKHQK